MDSNGHPIEFIISDGATNDVKVASNLVDLIGLQDTEVLCADKGYDSEHLRNQIKTTATKANIPKKSNIQSANDHMDWYLYRIRHLIENIFAKLKQYRGTATRFDPLKQSFENTVTLACVYL